jgi:uncharacterized protein (TIGR02996 family)
MLLCSLSRCLVVIAVALVFGSASGCGGAQARKAGHMEKGEAFLAAGRFDKARVEFKNVLQIDPRDSDALYEMGVISEKLGNPRQSAAFYQAAIDVNHDHVGARVGLGRLYLLAGAPDRALELIKPALEKHPDDARLLTLRAAVRIQQQDASGALADASRAVELTPTDEDAVAVLAGVYNHEGDKAKARSVLEGAVQRIPKTTELRLALVQFYTQNGDLAQAEALLLKLVELKPGDKIHRLRLAQFYLESHQADAAERILRQAIKDLPTDNSLKVALVDFLAAQRSRGQAEAELKGMIAAAPDDNDLRFALANFYAQGKDLDQAQAVYQGIIARENLEPVGLTARDRLGALRLQSGDTAGALALANEVLAKSPRDEEALLLRGNVALVNKDPRSAIADLRAVLRDRPTAVGVLETLARAHLENGEPDIAEETLRKAVEANPNNQELRLVFARLLMQRGKPDEAQAIALDLARQAPGSLDVLDVEFRASSKIQDYETAKSAADAIVALRPKLAVGYFYEGMIAEARGHPDEALRLYHQATEMQSDTADALEAEVQLLSTQKRLPEALKRLDDLASRDPKNAFAFNLKGNLLAANGRPVEAEAAFRQAIARAPKWWLPYRGLATAQLAAKLDPRVAVATLRDAEPLVDEREYVAEELASLLDGLGRHDEAIGEYESIIRDFPQSEAAANNLAMLLATYRTDRTSLDRAKQLALRFADSSNAAYLDTYGWVLYKCGDSAASVPVLARVVAKLPDQSFARYHLGMAQALAGKNSEARDNLTRAVNSGQRFSGIEEARATLDKIAKLPDTAAAPPNS